MRTSLSLSLLFLFWPFGNSRRKVLAGKKETTEIYPRRITRSSKLDVVGSRASMFFAFPCLRIFIIPRRIGPPITRDYRSLDPRRKISFQRNNFLAFIHLDVVRAFRFVPFSLAGIYRRRIAITNTALPPPVERINPAINREQNERFSGCRRRLDNNVSTNALMSRATAGHISMSRKGQRERDKKGKKRGRGG